MSSGPFFRLRRCLFGSELRFGEYAFYNSSVDFPSVAIQHLSGAIIESPESLPPYMVSPLHLFDEDLWFLPHFEVSGMLRIAFSFPHHST